MLHCMIDLETMGRAANAAIVQIGWCFFTEQEIIASGMRRIHLKSAIEHGEVGADTMLWWLGQSEEARRSVFTDDMTETLEDALLALKNEITLRDPRAFWAHATFDFPKLTHAYESTNVDDPIYFRNCRDIRTLDMLACTGHIENWPKREGIYHNAMDDAVYQAKCVQVMLRELRWAQ